MYASAYKTQLKMLKLKPLVRFKYESPVLADSMLLELIFTSSMAEPLKTLGAYGLDIVIAFNPFTDATFHDRKGVQIFEVLEPRDRFDVWATSVQLLASVFNTEGYFPHCIRLFRDLLRALKMRECLSSQTSLIFL